MINFEGERLELLFIRLWNYFRGYVIIKIEGEYGERLINQVALQGIFLWDIKRVSRYILIAKVSVQDFLSLRPFVRNTRCHVSIIKRVGFFFYLNQLKKRRSLVAGAILFIVGIYFLSSLVWSVEINTSDNNLKSKIEKDLNNWGIKRGTFKHKLNKKACINKILDKYKEVAWAEIQIKGSKLVVEIVKRQLPPQLEENNPCDIIASKDGVIEEIIPLKGEALVEPGDTVSKGDVLISGRIVMGSNKQQDLENENYSDREQEELLVSAKGLIKARVRYKKTVKVPLVKKEKKHTGAVKKVYVFQLGNTVFNINSKEIPFEIFDEEIEKQFSILPNYLNNFRLTVLKYREQKIYKKFLGVEGATKVAEKELLQYCDENFKDKKVVRKRMDFNIDIDDQAVVGSLTLEVVEDIGKKEKLNS